MAEIRAELRAHTQALNALRETQLELQEENRAGFATVNAGTAQIARRISGAADAEQTELSCRHGQYGHDRGPEDALHARG